MKRIRYLHKDTLERKPEWRTIYETHERKFTFMKANIFNSKRFLSLFLALVMIIGMLPMNIFTAVAATTPTVYDGVPVTPTKITSENYAQFGFTADNWSQYDGYYGIRNAKELYGFANFVNGDNKLENLGNGLANAVLTQDIIVNETVTASGANYSWPKIGNGVYAFGSDWSYDGIFDGNGHTISGLYVSGTDENVGLFGALNNAEIKNVILANSYFAGSQYVGGIVGFVSGNKTTISNCKICEDVIIEGTGNFVGGIVGGSAFADSADDGNDNQVKNCVSFATVNTTASTNAVGGIAGAWAKETDYMNRLITFTNCYYQTGRASNASGTVDWACGTYATGTGWARNEGCTAISSASDNHTCIIVEHKAVAANCTYPGSSASSFCLICGENNKTVIPTNSVHFYSGGDCVNEEICILCGGKGNKHSDNHISDKVKYENNGDTHTVFYACCLKEKTTEVHSYDSVTGICVCGYADGKLVYVDRVWNEDTKTVDSSVKSTSTYKIMTSSDTSLGEAGKTTWYVVNSDLTFSSRITVNGDVRLVLADGYTLTLSGNSSGITVNTGNSLYIYGQSNSTGKITGTTSEKNNAFIGSTSGTQAGTIVINGGAIDLSNSGNLASGAIIGGASRGGVDSLIINGGTIKAQVTGTSVAAAIGSGENSTGNCAITINGGNILAKSRAGASIGGGRYASGKLLLTINGATINAQAALSGAGVGTGYGGSSSGSTVVINGGSINASSGSGNAVGAGNYGNDVISVTDGTNAVTLKKITLSGAVNAKVTAMEGLSGYGLNDVYTDGNGVLYFYLPSTATLPTSIIAGGVEYVDKNSDGTYELAHEHSWEYNLDGTNKIVATCNADGCTFENASGGYVEIKEPTSLTYTGSNIEAVVDDQLTTDDAISIKYVALEGSLTEDKPVNVGKYKATVSVGGKDVSVEYSIGARTITENDVSVSDAVYTGSALTPTVKVTVNGKTLTKDTDYKVEYSNNTAVGNATVTITGDGNYTGTVDKDFDIAYLTGAPDATITGETGNDGWYTGEVILIAPKNYTISKTVDGTYSTSVSYEAEQNETATYYLKNSSGQIAQKTMEIKIDLNKPTAQYKIGTDGWKQFVNTITFGLFCKDYKTIEIEYSDTGSGVATKQYYIANAKVEDTSKISWSDYTDKLNLNATGTYFVYMRVVDNAGYEVILNSEGIVIYEGSTPENKEVHTTYGSTADVKVEVNLNGNTITDVKSNDQSWITDKNACTVNGNTITLKGDYLKRLGANTYTLTVYYAPQGVETDEVELTTTITLVIAKAKLTVTANDATATYGDAVPSYTVKYDGFVNGEDKDVLGGTLGFYCDYKQYDDVGNYDIAPHGLKSDNYLIGYNPGKLTVSPKQINVAINNATSVYGDPIAELTGNDNGIVNGDKNVYKLTTEATSTSDVGNYVIKGETLDDNYIITFMDESVSYTITKRELTVSVVVANKQYDGLNNATITSAKLNNVANGDQIVLSSATATFASVNVANGISINLTPFSISGDKADNYTLTQPTGITANITNGWNPAVNTEYTTNGSDWKNTDFVITAKDGYVLSLTNTANGTWVNTLTGNVEGADSSVKFYVKNTADGTISEMATANYKLDKVAPTGSVEFVERKAWQEFVNTITFGLFYDSEVTVKVSADDELSGVDKIEYASSDKAMTLDEVKAITDWTEYTDSFGVTYEEAKQFVYFVRITDNAGNVTYLSTDGAEYDNTDPVISGVENEKTYYTTQKVTVTEKNVASIKVNGVDATAEITLDGNVDKTYTIVATDKAGNTTTVIVTMKPISELSKPIDNVDTTNVNSSNEQAVDKVKADVAAVDTTNATDAEKEALKAITDKATELEKVIDDTKTEIARITEEMAKYDDATVNSDDAEALEQLGKDIKALTDGGNLTEAERTALTEDAADVTAMQKIVTDTTTENDRISDKVDEYDLATVTSDDKEDLEQLLADIEKQLESTNLTDEEKSELNGEKKAVEDLLTKIKGTDELIDKLTDDVDGYSDETVKSTDKDAIEQIIEDIDALLDTENLTEDEEKALEDAKAKAEGLLDTIEDAADATESENTEKVKDVTTETVTLEDKTDLEKAKEDLEKALEDYGDNYTEDEKKAVEDEIKRIDDALEVIGNVENVEELIDKLPDTIKKDDANAIKAADDAYNALTDYEKTLVDADAKKALDDAKAALAELNKPKDPNSPATGDNSNMFLWIALLFISGGAVITLTVVDRKKRIARK